jgi:predicted outer membrane repeat protein
MQIMYSLVYITQSYFSYNNATERTKNIFIGFSTVVISNCQFKDKVIENKIEKAKNTQTLGTFIFVMYDVNLYIKQSKFLNGVAMSGGALYISGDSSININDCEFLNNYARLEGGAIYGSGFSSLNCKNNNFKNNIALENGGDFFITNTEKNLTLDSLMISNPNTKSSIYAETVSLQIINTTISDIYNNDSTKGSAILCYNCRAINITLSKFINLKSQQGGAIYIEENENNKKSTDKIGKY